MEKLSKIVLSKTEEYMLNYRMKKIKYNNVGEEIQRIPILFVDKIYFISPKSFQQNHIILSKRIRKYVLDYFTHDEITHAKITSENLICFGGESYIYALYLNLPFIFITNNNYIKNDCIFNCNRKIPEIFEYTNYEKYINSCNCVIINMSNIYEHIIKFLLKTKPKTIIIISCHHDNFWKRITPLRRFYILKRKKFICEKLQYFITVNVLKLVNILPLGGNCSVAYMLKYYNIRKRANLFDWSKISISQLYYIIKNYNNPEMRIKFLSIEKTLNSNFDVFEEHGNILYKNSMNILFASEIKDRFYDINYDFYIRLETKPMTNFMIKEYKKLFHLLDGKFILISDKPIFKFGFTCYKNILLWNIKLELFESWKFSSINWYNIFNYIYEG